MSAKTNLEFQAALEKRRIISFPPGVKLIIKELGEAENDLFEAKDRYENKKYKYATINAYYAMFHTARAFIYSKGYREKSHYYLLVALQALFVDNNLLSNKLLEEFREAMILRESADYHGEFSKEGAEALIVAAIEFIKTAKQLLKNFI